MKEVRLIAHGLKLKSSRLSSDELITVQHHNPWDAAHEYRQENDLKIYVEPDIDNNLYETEDFSTLTLKSIASGYLKKWPAPPEIADKFVWHLQSDFSELKEANAVVWEKIKKEKCIKIAHIDTGYQPGHPALPKHLNTGISFVKGEEGRAAIDTTRHSLAEQDGHGTATMSILAGQNIFYNTDGITYEGDFGAIPFAEIIPIRISDTVALMWSNNFVKAVEYAIQQGCEVISMSMAGAPTKAWADVVNKAYDAGVTLVTAAGNSWNKGGKKLLPKRLLYPARWDRVIAATGVTSNHLPYIFKAQLSLKSEGGETMQGNYGPSTAMKTAIAAYTPNTPWATMNASNKGMYYRLDGGGTSSATPQIAAAAALWLSYYREELEVLAQTEKWKKVEAVKHALFQAADKNTYEEWEKYYGNGILKATKALSIPPDESKLEKAKKAKSSLHGILDFLRILLGLKSNLIKEEELNENEMFATEILQHLHTIPELYEYLDIGEKDESELWSTEEKERLKETLLNSEVVSKHLKERLRLL